MKQIVSNYSYSPATNVVTLTGVNIDADQLLLIVAPQVGRTLYNFASVTGVVSAGADTRVTLNASTSGLTTTSPLVIFYDDQASTQTVAGTVTANVLGFDPYNGTYPQLPVGMAVEGFVPNDNVVKALIGTESGGVSTSNPLPISGAVTAQLGSNPFATSVTVQTITGGQNGSPVAYGDQLGIYEVNLGAPGSYCIQSGFLAGQNFVNTVTLSLATPFSETVVTSANILGGLLFRRPPIDGINTHFRITATTTGMTPAPFTATVRAISDAYYGLNRSVSGTVTVGNSVTIGSLPAISGTVTANASNGSLTTRFGTPTTASVAFATSCVTNANRKYLLIQNVTTGSNVITVGIGFTPTTTQGIQLTAGAGITFESSYIPTGQIFVLSSVTASNFTILEA